MEDKSAAQQIDAIIKKYDDWRGEMMSRLRALIKQADPALPLDHFGGLVLAWYSSDILTVLREPEEAFYRYALRREESERLGIEYVQADLSTWTPPPDPFDVVIANMVLMDIPDYEPALNTCVAALTSQGGLIVSLLHPCFEEAGSAWKEKGEVSVRDYFRERAVKQDYGYFIHPPLSTYLNSIMRAGCMLQSVIEPQLEQSIAAQHHAERYWLVPGSIVIFATRIV